MPTRLSRMFVHSRMVGILIIVVLIVSGLYTSYTSQQQLDEARHLNRVVQCQTRVNNQFNAVLKYNTRLNNETNTLNDKDRKDLRTMVQGVGAGIEKNDGAKIRNSINDFNQNQAESNKKRAALERQRAQFPPLPQEQCR